MYCDVFLTKCRFSEHSPTLDGDLVIVPSHYRRQTKNEKTKQATDRIFFPPIELSYKKIKLTCIIFYNLQLSVSISMNAQYEVWKSVAAGI